LISEQFEVSAWRDLAGAVEFLRRREATLLIIGAVSDNPYASIGAIERLKSATRAPVLFTPAESSEALAIAALRLLVNEYLPPPVSGTALIEAVRRLAPAATAACGIIGRSQAMVKIKAALRKVASNSCNALITGETGTGKELVAEQIHALSPRCDKPFVAVNCAAIPDSLLESELFGYERGAFTGASRRTDGLMHAAEGGTLFLDEIGDMSLGAQSKILRAIDTSKIRRVGTHVVTPIDVRLIAATHQELDTMSDNGRFRPDLYFRLNVARLDLPPLRERPEDIPLLVHHFLAQFGGHDVRLAEEASSLLQRYRWPGNIRELKNVIQSTLVYLSNTVIHIEDLPEFFLRKASVGGAPGTSERSRILDVLEQTSWNKSRAAESLHWSRMTLYRKMAKYQLGTAATVRKASA
jgi:DNA-binding NtrC family response regulator